MIAGYAHFNELFGPTPRQLPQDVAKAMASRGNPDWMPGGHPLIDVPDAVEDIVTHGRLAIGHVFMANTDLFEPGPDDLPGGVVYSFDPVVWANPHLFEPVAERLFRCHFQAPDAQKEVRSPWLSRVRDGIWTGTDHDLHCRLPPAITGGRPMYQSSVLFRRRDLPNGFLESMVVPLLVLPPSSPSPHRSHCLVIPSQWWESQG